MPPQDSELIKALFIGGPWHGQEHHVDKWKVNWGVEVRWFEPKDHHFMAGHPQEFTISPMIEEHSRILYKYVPQTFRTEATMFADTYTYRRVFAPSTWSQGEILAALGEYLIKQWILNDPDGTIVKEITLDEQLRRNKERAEKRDPTLYRPRPQSKDTGTGMG